MKNDLLDLIDYHEKRAKATKLWTTADDREKAKELHFFHTRSVVLLTKLKEDLYGK